MQKAPLAIQEVAYCDPTSSQHIGGANSGQRVFATSNSPDRILPRWVTERLPSLRDNLNQRHHSHLEIDALVPGRYQNNPSHIGGVTLRIYRRAYRRIL